MIINILILTIILFSTTDIVICQEIFGIEEKIKIFHEFLTIKDPSFYKWLITQYYVLDINLEFCDSKEEIKKYAQEIEQKYLSK